MIYNFAACKFDSRFDFNRTIQHRSTKIRFIGQSSSVSGYNVP